jgi:hypothetical protein
MKAVQFSDSAQLFLYPLIRKASHYTRSTQGASTHGYIVAAQRVKRNKAVRIALIVCTVVPIALLFSFYLAWNEKSLRIRRDKGYQTAWWNIIWLPGALTIADGAAARGRPPVRRVAG